MAFFELIRSVAREMLGSFMLNFLFIPVYVIIIILLRSLYEKYAGMAGYIAGRHAKTVKQSLEESVLFGLVAGFVGSIAAVGTGVVLNAEVFQYMIAVMALMVLINIRYICFSYPAGIIALASFVFHMPDVDIPSLLGLAAILHIFEAGLIYIDAGRDSIPVLIRHKGELTGAFLTRKYWPVPVVFLTTAMSNASGVLANVSHGSVWPLFKPGIIVSGVAALGLDCAISVLGYSDIAIARQPEKRNRETALQTLCYGTALFLFAVLSRNSVLFRLVGAAFCLAAHEALILYARHHEKGGEPIFKPTRRGLKVLDIIPGSHAERMGLSRGDTILGINGRDIQTEAGIAEALREFPTFTWIKVKDAYGKEKTYEYKCYPGGYNRLGIISVPREQEVTYNIDYYENLGIIKNLVARFRSAGKTI